MKKILSAALLVAAASTASAQAYVEGAYGITHFNADCSGTTSCDNGDTGFKVVGGWKFAPNLAFEAAYISFGEAKASALGLDMTHESTAFVFGGAARGQLAQDLSGVIRLGLASVSSEFRASNGYSDEDSAVSVHFGLGLEYAFTKNFKATAGLDFTTSAEVAGMDSGSLRLISIGAQYEF